MKLAELLHAGLAQYFDTAAALGDALSTHGLDRQIVHGVRAFRITMGEISVPEALTFGTALGASPFLRKVTTEDHDLSDGEHVSRRLTNAVTSGAQGFIGAEYIPWCANCEIVPRVFLGALDLDVAQRLAAALHMRAHRA